MADAPVRSAIADSIRTMPRSAVNRLLSVEQRWDRSYPRWGAIAILWGIVLGGCGTLSPSAKPPCVSPTQAAELSAGDSAVVQSLCRQLGEKEHRMTKLQSRLNALEQSTEDSPAMQTLRRQLSEKDEHIAKLQSRLNALKLIEEDRQKRQKFRQRRAIIIPPK